MTQENYGALNGHSVGRILKETVRRAMVAIRNERLIFEAKAKAGYDGEMNDVCTSADKKAQEIYVKAITECFPDFGIIAEEENFQVKSKNGGGYFTIDGLDGTKAFVRRQSHGVGTMIAMVWENEVISAYVGDVNTNEVYGYRPGSNKVHRIMDSDIFEELPQQGRNTRYISQMHICLRDPLTKYSATAQKLVARFKSYEVIGSSIGTWMAQLWKGEVGALLLPPSKETPWDSAPIIGITQKLGYRFALESNGHWVGYERTPTIQTYKREVDMLVISKYDGYYLQPNE